MKNSHFFILVFYFSLLAFPDCGYSFYDANVEQSFEQAKDPQKTDIECVKVDSQVLTSSFVTTWKTDNEGVSCNTCIVIPTFPGESYNYDVDWDNDGVFEDIGVNGDAAHDYEIAGTYTVAIRGTFPRIYCNGLDAEFEINPGEAGKLLTIDQWGVIEWTSMSEAFEGCNNLRVVDSRNPILSNVTSMRSMFSGTEIGFSNNIVTDFSGWDVSTVTDMGNMFRRAFGFTSDLSAWDVSSVTNMENIFFSAERFSSDLSTWDVSSVTNMSGMFSETNLISGLSDWDVSSVTNMSNMFSITSRETLDLSDWDVSSVTNMSSMFESAQNFTSDLSDWDVSSVTNMRYMFAVAENFTSDLSDWDVSSVTNMSGMFADAQNFTSDLSDWDVSSVTDMGSMFAAAKIFTSDLSKWDVSSVTNMSGMFAIAEIFSSNLSDWNVSSVTDMTTMFVLANDFNSDLSDWDISSVTGMFGMFQDANSFTSDLSGWDVSSVINLNSMFEGASMFDSDLGTWDLSSVVDDLGNPNDGLQDMLSLSGLSQENYESTLLGWSNNSNTPSLLVLGAEGLEYCDETGRDALILNLGWAIEGDIKSSLTFYVDLDGDGFGDASVSVEGCSQLDGYSENAEDCDDSNGNINPEAVDIINNGIDEDCDGMDATTTSVFQLADSEIKIYPNPASSFLNIDVSGNLEYFIQIINLNGKIVQTLNQSNLIDLRSLNSGIYMIKISDVNSSGNITEKLVIAK